MEKQIDKTLEHIKDLEHRLCKADNNLRYIKALQALKHSLDKFHNLLLTNTELQQKYQTAYLSFFASGLGLSFYDRICNSIAECKYGNKPF